MFGKPTLLIFLLGLSLASAEFDFAKVWNFTTTDVKISPAEWSAGFKDKATKAAIVAGVFYSFRPNVVQTAAVAIATVGLVRLDYQLVALLVGAIYGYFHRQKYLLVVCSYCAYNFAFTGKLI